MYKIKELGDSRYQVTEVNDAGKTVKTFPDVFTSREDAQAFIKEQMDEEGEMEKE